MKILKGRAAVSGGVAAAALMVAGGALAQPRTFDVAAQAAVRSIPEFARQSGLQITAPADDLGGVSTAAIRGRLDARAALTTLLQGTGLVVATDDGAVIVLKRAAEAVGSRAAADTLSVGEVDRVIVTGTRSTSRTVTYSLAPIDVLSSVELGKTGKISARDLISTLVPSATTSNSGAGASFAIKTVSLRGLDADQTLVLVNGKRRHNTSILFVNGTTQNGQSPPDLDLIPVSAIDHIEVLRDGASAQYGSDALAGVINVILKTAGGGSATGLYGDYIDGGGMTWQGAGNVGLPVGRGLLNLSIDLRDQGAVDRGVPYTGVFFPLINGQPDPREATVDRHINHPGAPAIQLYSVGDDFEYPIRENASLYAFGTVSSRASSAWLTPRLPGAAGNQIIQVYPLGYSPKLRLLDHDFQQNIGIKGSGLLGFDYDLSTSYSQDNVAYNEDSLNASLGPASPTRFYLGNLNTDETTTNVDLSRNIRTGWFASPLFLALGAEYRWDQLAIVEGQPESYIDGGFVEPAGQLNAGVINQAGAQGVSGFGPLSAGVFNRNNVSLYLNGEQSVLDNWDLSIAGRYEHYSDFGDAETYKVSTRYEPVHGFALRGTIASGFKAPSLQQEHYASASTIGVKLPGAATTSLFPVELLPPTTAAAKALGATPLRPETSTNYSAGFVAQPVTGLSVTVDAYDVDISNRILQSAALGPAVAVSQALASVGLNPQQAVFFYTNGASTRTYGLDLVAEYRRGFGSAGSVHWTFSADFNHTTFLSIEQPPANLVAAGLVLIDRSRIGDLTLGNPREKFVFSTDWTYGRFDTTLRLNGYGSVVQVASVAAGGAPADDTVSAAVTVDLDISARITDRIRLSAGGSNLLDKYPNVVKPVNRGVTGFTYSNQYAPYGIAGGFYYTKLAYRF
jgi:iron complex outermembrane receptor protein